MESPWSPRRVWVPSTEEASRYGLPSLLLHSPLLHALCPPRCLERSFRRCPHLTSAPPCLSSQEVSSKRLWSPSRALAESSHPAEKPPPVAPLCPGTVPAWDFIVPVAQGGGCAALGTPDSAALGTPQRPGCASPRMLPPAALLPWVPSTAPPPPPPPSSPPVENPLLGRDGQPQQGTLPETRRCKGHEEQGYSQAGTAKPWERAALGAGPKLQPCSLQWPFPAPPKLTHCRVQISQPPRKDPHRQTRWFANGALLNRRKHWL